MPKTHAPYPPEYRQQVVELVRAGRTPGELAREFEVSAQATGESPFFVNSATGCARPTAMKVGAPTA